LLIAFDIVVADLSGKAVALWKNVGILRCQSILNPKAGVLVLDYTDVLGKQSDGQVLSQQQTTRRIVGDIGN